MPWEPADAERFTRKATTPKLRRMWQKVANAELERTGDEGQAVKAANSAVKHHLETKNSPLHRAARGETVHPDEYRKAREANPHWSGH